jgi:hypothetical protein
LRFSLTKNKQDCNFNNKYSTGIMTSFEIDYSQITLQENIPLSNGERILVENEVKHLKPQSLYLAIFLGLSGAIMYTWLFEGFNFLQLLVVLIAVFLLAYIICRLVIRSAVENTKKDIATGKSILKSVVLAADYNSDGADCLFLASKQKGLYIKVLLTPDRTQQRYNAGDQIIVEFLPYSQKALTTLKVVPPPKNSSIIEP